MFFVDIIRKLSERVFFLFFLMKLIRKSLGDYILFTTIRNYKPKSTDNLVTRKVFFISENST